MENDSSLSNINDTLYPKESPHKLNISFTTLHESPKLKKKTTISTAPILRTSRKNIFHENCVCSYKDKEKCNHEIHNYLRKDSRKNSITSINGISIVEERDVDKILNDTIKLKSIKGNYIKIVDNKLGLQKLGDTTNEESLLFEIIFISNTNNLIYLKNILTNKYLSVSETQPYELNFLSCIPNKYQTFELVQSNIDENISTSNTTNTPTTNYNINLSFSLKSVYGRYVGLNLENIYSASRMAGRNIDQFYIIGHGHSNANSNTNSLQTSLKPNPSISTQTRIHENATDFIKNIVKHEIEQIDNLNFHDYEVESELVQLLDHLQNFNFNKNKFTIPKDRKSSIDILYDSTKTRPKAVTINDFENEYLASVQPVVQPSLFSSELRKIITADLDDSGIVNSSLNESKIVADQLNFSEVVADTSMMRIDNDNNNNDVVYDEMLNWLNNNGAAITKKPKMEIVNVEKNNAYVVLVSSNDDETVQAYTYKKKEKYSRLSDIFLGGLEDNNPKFQRNLVDYDDAVNNEPMPITFDPIEITEVKPEFYFFVKKRVKEMYAEIEEVQEHPASSVYTISTIQEHPMSSAITVFTQHMQTPLRVEVKHSNIAENFMIDDEGVSAFVYTKSPLKNNIAENFALEDEGIFASVKIKSPNVKKPNMQDLIIQNEDLKFTIKQLKTKLEETKIIQFVKKPMQVTKFHNGESYLGPSARRFVRVSHDEKSIEWCKNISFESFSKCDFLELISISSNHDRPEEEWKSNIKARVRLEFKSRNLDLILSSSNEASMWKHSIQTILQRNNILKKK